MPLACIRRHLYRLIALAAFVGGCLVASSSAQTVNTFPSWNGSDFIWPFGEGDAATATYGQTFTVPTGYDQLESFSLTLRPLSGGNIDFAAYVAEWDGAKYVGPLLFSSGPRVLPSSASSFTPFTFSTGSLLLNPTKAYVAFLSASNFFDGIDSRAAMGSPGEAYAGGNFVYFNNGSDFSLLHTSEWEGLDGALGDAAFRADFSASPRAPAFVAVPESSTYGLMGGLGLAGLIALRRFRRKISA